MDGGDRGELRAPLAAEGVPRALGDIVQEIRTHGAPAERQVQGPPGLTLRPITAVGNVTAADFDARCALTPSSCAIHIVGRSGPTS